MGMDLLDADGCSEIIVNSWEDWEKFYNVCKPNTLPLQKLIN
jgi:hypothetical protein